MNAFLQELEQVSAELRQRAGQFAAQQRQDDADLTKIRANIYEICATIGKVMCKTQPEEARKAGGTAPELAGGAGGCGGARQHPACRCGGTEAGSAG